MKLFQLLATLLILAAIMVAHRMNHQELFHHAHSLEGVLDDSDETIFPHPPFRVMSNFETTLIDTAINGWFISSISQQESINDAEADIRIDQICIFYDGRYTNEQKYTFLLYMTHLITQIDTNNKRKDLGTLRTTLASVKFFENPEGVRGQAGRRNALINTQLISTRQELFEVLTHEIAGHIFDLGVLDDPDSPKSARFKEFGKEKFGAHDWSLSFYELSWVTDQYAHNTDFVSRYGGSNPFEGYAEFTNAWINHHAPLIKLAKQNDTIKQKYIKMSELYGTRFINLDIATYKTMPLQSRPYDTTQRDNTLERF